MEKAKKVAVITPPAMENQKSFCPNSEQYIDPAIAANMIDRK
jgi:hypothetical protein